MDAWHPRRKGPGIARADRGRSAPIRAWLNRADGDEAALEGMALAWSELPLGARRQCLVLLRRDLHERGDSRARLFAMMMALEDDAELLGMLLDAICGPAQDVGWGRLAGDERSGTAMLVLGCPGAESTMILEWEAGVGTRLQVLEPKHGVEEDALVAISARTARVTKEDAVNAMAAPLLRYRRAGGTWPGGARRFAALFG